MTMTDKITTLAAELNRLGLTGRVKSTSIKPETIEVYATDKCSASSFNGDIGRLFCVAGGGSILYSWAQAGGRGDHRFRLAVGYAVIVKADGLDMVLELIGVG